MMQRAGNAESQIKAIIEACHEITDGLAPFGGLEQPFPRGAAGPAAIGLSKCRPTKSSPPGITLALSSLPCVVSVADWMVIFSWFSQRVWRGCRMSMRMVIVPRSAG